MLARWAQELYRVGSIASKGRPAPCTAVCDALPALRERVYVQPKLMLTGKAKTDYQREYMRRRRAAARASKQGSNQWTSATWSNKTGIPVRPQKELTYERDDYSQ